MISKNNKIIFQPLAVTMGDPAGIGPEIILKSYQKRFENDLPPFVVYGCPNTLKERANLLKLECSINEISAAKTSSSQFKKELPVIPIPASVKPEPGKPNPKNSKSVIECISLATQAVMKSEAKAIVTNPISKSTLYGSGFKYPGHTEYLAQLAQSYHPKKKYLPVMMLVSKSLRVVPVTIHIPIKEVPTQLSSSLIERTIKITIKSLKDDFGLSNAKIFVSGLNPHAGEQGTMGREEIDIIKPVIDKLKETGENVSGPYPADTLFNPENRNSFDAAICMYHDQALIPFKTLDFDTGVNLTIGLPFIRTSPDHGTAFQIAHLGIASPNSFISALKLADEISKHWKKQNT